LNEDMRKLDEIFSPRGVAVVGASPAKKRSFINDIVLGLKEAGFPAIYPIHPGYTTAFGLPCYPNIQAVPGPVDHVIVSIPAEASLALLDDCAAKHVRSVHFFTAGFSESGYAERAELERQMINKARKAGLRIIGPNCVGIYVPENRLIFFRDMPLKAGPIAFLSQSGGHAILFPIEGQERGVFFSKVVSYGNGLDLNESELLEYFAQDPKTEIIAAYVEGVKDGRRLMKALKDASGRKPVVLYKGGTTAAGQRATMGHTASLTSSTAIFDAVCKQAKVIQVEDPEELMDALVAMRYARPIPSGTGVVVLGIGGGPSVWAGDEVEKAGLRLPSLSSAQQAELKKLTPVAGSIFHNPLDMGILGSPKGLIDVIDVLDKVPEIGMFMFHYGFHPYTMWGRGERGLDKDSVQPIVAAFKEARAKIRKPILFVLKKPGDRRGSEDFMAAEEALVEAGFAVFYSFRQAARAMARVISWGQSSSVKNN
jgi:acyl-CoA synthetase (NDP forming)